MARLRNSLRSRRSAARGRLWSAHFQGSWPELLSRVRQVAGPCSLLDPKSTGLAHNSKQSCRKVHDKNLQNNTWDDEERHGETPAWLNVRKYWGLLTSFGDLHCWSKCQLLEHATNLRHLGRPLSTFMAAAHDAASGFCFEDRSLWTTAVSSSGKVSL